MAKKEKESVDNQSNIDDVTNDIIRAVNKEFGNRVAYNLAVDDAPSNVKRWIDTGSVQLNYMIRNAPKGGYPESRVIEVSGMPSTGKSHLACACAANVQKQGGLVIYIDTESAIMLSKLAEQGVNVKKGFVYVETSCTEEVFSVMESTILKAKLVLKDVPILIVWDSIAATSPKAELEGDYDQNTMGLQARVIAKGMRKIIGVIGHNNVTLLLLNQLRDAIGVLHGDPHITPGGRAIPFASSVRVRLSSGIQVKDKAGNVIGSHVICTTKKNKLAPNFRKYEFDIIFGKGIVEHEYIYDEIVDYLTKRADNNRVVLNNEAITVGGGGAWKELVISDVKTGEVKLEKKFYKSEFGSVMKDAQYSKYCDALIEATYVITNSSSEGDENEVTPDVEI